MNTIEWSDRQGHRNRAAWLLLVHWDEVLEFRGEAIPQVVAVMNRAFKKDGKWSHSTYRLALADGVRAIAGKNGWETGSFAEGLGRATERPTPGTWAEMAAALGVSAVAAERFIRSTRPKAAAVLDEVERALAALS